MFVKKSMIFIKDKKIELFTIVFLFFYFGLSLSFLPIQFAINDDIAILSDIKNNVNTSFMSPILGYFLSFLYYINSDIAWYGWFLYFIHFISLYIIITSFLKNNFKQIYIYGFLTLYLLFYIDFIVRVSYNNASIMFGISVFIYVLINIKNMSNKKAGWIGLLFVVSYLIRQESIYFIVCFSAPAFYFVKEHYKKLFYFFFPIIMIISAHKITDNFAFSKEQKEFNEFNRIRGEFHDYPVSIVNYGNEQILKANNWTNNDYVLLFNWFFIDEVKFNKETLSNIFKYSKSLYLNNTDLNKKQKEILKDLEKNYIYYFMIVLIVIFYSIINLKKTFLLLGYLIYSLFGIFTLLFFFRFPTHIAKPVFMIIFVIILYSINIFKDIKNNKILSILVFLLAAIFTLKIIDLNRKVTGYFIEQINYKYLYLNKLNTIYKDNTFLFIIRPDVSIPLHINNPLLSKQIKFNFIDYGWKTFSPSFYKSIKKYLEIDYAHEIFPKIAEKNKKIFLIFPDNWKQFIDIYLKEKFNEEYILTKIDYLYILYPQFGSIGIYSIIENK